MEDRKEEEKEEKGSEEEIGKGKREWKKKTKTGS